MSINGWFHTSKPLLHHAPTLRLSQTGLYSNNHIKHQNMEIDLDAWVTPMYLESRSIRQIQTHMENDSEISLRSFFREEFIGVVLKALNYEGKKIYLRVDKVQIC